MPNDPYLDASVAWRIRTGNLDFRDADYRTTAHAILDSGLATGVEGVISAGKEADVLLCSLNGVPLAVKVYRLYRTSHRGGGPIKLDRTGWLAAHEYDMLLQAWKGGARVPTPARRTENMLSMRYLGDEGGHAPRLQEVTLDRPEEFLEQVLDGVRKLAHAGIVHTDLSAFNILVFRGEPWIIDLSEAVRVDRTGTSPWIRLTQARGSMLQGLASLQTYFRRYDLRIDAETFADEVLRPFDRFGVMRT